MSVSVFLRVGLLVLCLALSVMSVCRSGSRGILSALGKVDVVEFV